VRFVLALRRRSWSCAAVAEVTCADGSVLGLRPVPVRARDDVAYEVTLELLRDGAPFGQVGERCGWFLASAAARVRAALTGGGPPTTAVEAGVRRWAARTGADPERTWTELDRYLPRDRELLALRSRDPDDVAVTGELRVEVRRERTWVRGDDDRGRWELAETAVLDAWGDGGVGVRALLSCAELLDLLEALIAEVARVGAAARSG
jgi:hypothetical protein